MHNALACHVDMNKGHTFMYKVMEDIFIGLRKGDIENLTELREKLEAYAGIISALRAQGDLSKEKKDLLGELSKVLSISTERHRAEVRRAVNDERLTTIAHHMSGPNSSSEWSIEGRRLVPLMPRLVPQTAFTATANAVANAAAQHNASLPLPAETGSKEVVVCYSYTSTTSTPTSTTVPGGSVATVKSPRPASPASNVVVLPSGSTVYVKSVSCSDEDEKPRKRRRTNSSSSSPVVLKEVPRAVTPVSKTITVPVSGSPKMSNLMQSIANSLPPHMSPVKITFTKPTTQTTNTTTQKVIIVTTSPSSTFVPNILSKSHSYATVTKLVPTSIVTPTTQKQPVVITATQPSPTITCSNSTSSPTVIPSTIAVTTVVSSTPSVVMSTSAQAVSSSAVKIASVRQASPKSVVSSPTQILAQLPKHQQQSPKQQQSPQMPQTSQAGLQQSPQPQTPTTIKPTIQIKQESGVKIITQQMQPSKILPKPATATISSSSTSPIMVVSSNGTIMTTKLVTSPTGSQATYSRPAVTPTIGARMTTSTGATYVKTTSGSIITVVPKSLATLGGKIITSSIVSGTTTKITTIPMASKPNVIVVQKTTGKGTTIQGLPGKNVVTTLLNAGGEKLQAVPAGTKPAIITAARPITKMIVTQPKGIGSAVQPATKIIPTKIVYGQQSKTQVLIKPKPVTFQASMVSEQARQLVTETLQATRVTEGCISTSQEVVGKEDPQAYTDSSSSSTESSHSCQEPQPVVHVITTRGQEWPEHEVTMEASPTIIYQDVSSESQSATSTIKALLELQQTTVKEKGDSKLRQPTIDLSQMAVPIQMAQEKRQSSEGTSITLVEPDMVTEYISTGRQLGAYSAGKTARAGTTCSISSGEMALTSLLTASHQQTQSLQQTTHSQRAVVQQIVHAAAQSPVVVKSIPVSSEITHLVQQAVTSHSVATKQAEESGVEEGEVEEMDTLDPQTGLFYRSAQTVQTVFKQQKVSQPEHAQLQIRTVQHLQAKPQLKHAAHLQHELLQQRLHTTQQFQIKHPTSQGQHELAQTKHILQAQQVVSKERPVSLVTTQPQQNVVQVFAVKTPQQQLPKLQHIPTQKVQVQFQQATLKRPPPLEKHAPTQVQQPVISQGPSVTKITFEGHQAPVVSKSSSGDTVLKLATPVTRIFPVQTSDKTGAVADILKMSMMEAQIDTNVEPMIVEPLHDGSSTIKAIAEADTISTSHLQRAVVKTVQHQQCKTVVHESTSSAIVTPVSEKGDCSAVSLGSPFIRIQDLAPKKADDMSADILIQYSIPCHSSSNVVVEQCPGLVEINNFTSQRLADEETAMEQDVDSSAEEGTASPSQSSADQSQ
ncbi:BRCA2-interacting transcriptional repressor EMSY [Protopterus annectens]|uniref:BRCA2-interacting transcriptional repressor EMSY n=1 Tax=Protopterus annectens TaxID=7888 RepID=UPI001CFC185C|nr:BRCA2-interacting transcriptional repressor EMSY [Protopterus annectens]